MPRGAMALLTDPTFGPFFGGRVASACGLWVQNIAAALVMWQLTESAFLVGLVSVAQFAGPLILSVWTGLLTDVFDRRTVLLLGRLVSGIAALALCLIAVVAPGGLTPGPLVSCMLLLGVGYALSSPATHALIPALVPQQDLEIAVALNSLVGSLARAVGPAVGAVLVVAGGPAFAFGGAALGHLGFAVVLVFIRPVPTERATSARLLDGMRHVWNDRTTLCLLIAVTALSFGVDAVITLSPSVASNLGGTEASVGLLASAFGVGALLAAGLMRWLRARTTLRWISLLGLVVQAAGLSVIAVGASLGMASTGFAIAGCGFLWAATAINTRIQQHVPGLLRGRVMALWTVAFLGFRPIAALTNGAVADVFSLGSALMLGAAVSLAAIGVARVRYGSI